MGGEEGLMELSKEEQGRGEKLFNRIDMDASGEISVDEIQQVLPNVGDKEIMMKILDENANGAVDLAEWYTYLLRKKEAKGARKFGFFLNYMDQASTPLLRHPYCYTPPTLTPLLLPHPSYCHTNPA